MLQPATRRLVIILLSSSAISMAYCGWCFDRLTVGGFYDRKSGLWPRPFPYPDRWLSALERYYDAQNPPTPGFIKLHGERDRLLWMVLSGGCTLMVIWFPAAAALVWDAMRGSFRRRAENGFFLLVTATSFLATIIWSSGSRWHYEWRLPLYLLAALALWAIGLIFARSRQADPEQNKTAPRIAPRG